MQAKNVALFKILLNRYHPGIGEGILKNIPQEESKKIFEQRIDSVDPLPLLTLEKDLLRSTHYSWLSPSIQQLPKSLQPLIVASLPQPQSLRLSKALNMPIDHLNLSERQKDFFLDLLVKEWKPDPVLPAHYLPSNPLMALERMSKNELVEFIDFLSLYDLIDTLRHVVNKKFLKTIYQALSPKKQQFIRICLHHKEKIASPKLDLSKWSGDAYQLEMILHRRGLFRLGKALIGQNPDLIWHLIHKLDIGRGTILSKHISSTATPKVTSALVQQVVFVINFLKKKSET